MINWKKIASEVPADGKIYDYAGVDKVRHIPASDTRIEILLVLDAKGLWRRFKLPNGKWGVAHMIGGTIGE